jgi:hypothetical protein
MFLYNESYLNTYKRYRDIMNTDIYVVLKKLPSQSEDPIFKIKALPKSRKYIDDGREVNTSDVILFIDELEELTSINLGGSVKFPIKDIKNRVKLIRFNEFSYIVEDKNINFFNNILKFSLTSTIGG